MNSTNRAKFYSIPLIKILFLIVTQLLLINFICLIKAQNVWSVEILGGDTYCLKTPLKIKQTGYEDIKLSAKYSTMSFKLPVYYSIKLSKWEKNHGWEIEDIHLKILLKNKIPEIQKFNITHGYNFFTINRVWNLKYVIFRLGCGVILAHPENTIRGKSLSEDKGIFNWGYYLSGPATQISVGKKFKITNRVFLILETKITAAYTRVPVNGGHANVPHLGIHGLFGLGYRIKG